MSDKDLNIWAKIHADGMKQGSDQGITALRKLEDYAKKAGMAIAAAFSVAALTKAVKESSAAAAAEEMIFKRLENQVKATGASYASNERELKKMFQTMQSASRYADDQFAAALTRLIVLTGSLKKSLELLPLSAKLAGTGLTDLEGAATAIGRAASGQPIMLRRMLPRVKDFDDPIVGLKQIVGSMKGVAGTTAQLEARIANTRLDIKEAFGTVVNAEMKPWLQRIAEATEATRDAVQKDVEKKVKEDERKKELAKSWEEYGVRVAPNMKNVYIPEAASRRLSMPGLDFPTKMSGLSWDDMERLWYQRMNRVAPNPSITIGSPWMAGAGNGRGVPGTLERGFESPDEWLQWSIGRMGAPNRMGAYIPQQDPLSTERLGSRLRFPTGGYNWLGAPSWRSTMANEDMGSSLLIYGNRNLSDIPKGAKANQTADDLKREVERAMASGIINGFRAAREGGVRSFVTFLGEQLEDVVMQKMASGLAGVGLELLGGINGPLGAFFGSGKVK